METGEYEINPCYGLTQHSKKTEVDKVRNQKMDVNVEQTRDERGNKKWIGVFLVMLFFQALLLTALVVAAGFFSKETVTLRGQIQQLQLDQAQEQLPQTNDTNIWLLLNNLSSFVNAIDTTTMNQLSDLQCSVNTLNTTTMNQLSDLQSSVNTLNSTTMDQLNSLRSFVVALSTTKNSTDSTDTQVSSLQSSVNTLTAQQASTTSQVTSLQSSVNNLTSRINSISSIDLYQDCLQETRSCTLSAGLNPYWRSCSTTSLNANPSVSSVHGSESHAMCHIKLK